MVSVVVDGDKVTVNGERVRKGWAFTRNGAIKHLVFYIVERWGNETVDIRRMATPLARGSLREDVSSFTSAGNIQIDAARMTHADFVRFVETFYGMPFAEGHRIWDDASADIYSRSLSRGEQRTLAAERDAAYNEAMDIAADIREALGNDGNIYRLIGLIQRARLEGYEEGREVGYDTGTDEGYQEGYDSAYRQYTY